MINYFSSVSLIFLKIFIYINFNPLGIENII